MIRNTTKTRVNPVPDAPFPLQCVDISAVNAFIKNANGTNKNTIGTIMNPRERLCSLRSGNHATLAFHADMECAFPVNLPMQQAVMRCCAHETREKHCRPFLSTGPFPPRGGRGYGMFLQNE